MSDFTVFSDESHIDAQRYQSICSISLPSAAVADIEAHATALLTESNVTEFKWKKLASAKYRFAAEKLLTQMIDCWLDYGLRADTVVWDTHDERHAVIGRDDTANLGRMYFHLLKTVMRKRLHGSSWEIYPDEHVAIDWITLQDCLGSVGQWTRVFHLPLFGLSLEAESFTIEAFEERHSDETPLCQLADLLAGMAVYSINAYPLYRQWVESQNPQMDMFSALRQPEGIAQSDQQRLPCLHGFSEHCKAHKLGVSINGKGRLWTPRSVNPIGFWLYESQHPDDTAPIRV
jgi:hypothetical protein